LRRSISEVQKLDRLSRAIEFRLDSVDLEIALQEVPHQSQLLQGSAGEGFFFEENQPESA
jgi:hypothetical protein